MIGTFLDHCSNGGYIIFSSHCDRIRIYQVVYKMINFSKKIINFYYREYKVNLSGFQDILTIITFFFI